VEITLNQFVSPDSLLPQMKNIWYSPEDQFTSSSILSFQDVLHVLDDNNSSIFPLLSIFPQHAFTSIQSVLFKGCTFSEAIRIAIWSYHGRGLLACITF
jgi:hypothetical protein